jgi:lysophospholipase L1-like esterase
MVLMTSAATSAAATTGSPPLFQAPQAYYLALGDSMAFGYQPDKGVKPATFHTGYVDLLAARLAKLSPKIQVVNYGCPGESTVTFTRGGCDWLKGGMKLHDPFKGSQVDAAVAFLKAHPGKVSPITLTLWGNDLYPLSQQAKGAPKAIAAFEKRFSTILERLRAAAPKAEIIVSGAWNPEANALWKTEPLYRSVDKAIGRAAATSRARVANMWAAFNSGNRAAQKARLCKVTYFCSKGGDPHPTNAGYQAMADAFWAASGYPRS